MSAPLPLLDLWHPARNIFGSYMLAYYLPRGDCSASLLYAHPPHPACPCALQMDTASCPRKYFKGPILPATANLSSPTVVMAAHARGGELVFYIGFAQAYYAFNIWTQLKYDCFNGWVKRMTAVNDPTTIVKVCKPRWGLQRRAFDLHSFA